MRMVLCENWRMLLVFISMGWGISTEGYIFGHLSTFVAGLYAEKEDLQFTDDDISWITSIMFPSMALGTMLATFVTERYGRRLTIAAFNIPIIIHWIVLYTTRDKYMFIFIRFLVGLCFGGTVPIIFMASAEYSSPRIRGPFLSAITCVGPTVGGALGMYISLCTHWRIGALVAIFPTVLAALLPMFCVESPQWLASRGRFQECEEAFRALRGHKQSSEKELQLLLQMEKDKAKSDSELRALSLLVRRVKAAATERYFWTIMVLSSVINLYKTISGKILFGALGVTMLQKMSGQSDVLIPSIVMGIFQFIGCFSAPLISKRFNIRTILFAGGLLCNATLVGLCVTLSVFTSISVVTAWCNILLLSLLNLIVNATLFPVLEMLPSELYPLDVKSACVSIISLATAIFMFVYIKMLPGLFSQIGYNGVFLLHVGVMAACLIYLWIRLPETKGRTLQEIELYFKCNEFTNIDDLLDAEIKDNLQETSA